MENPISEKLKLSVRNALRQHLNSLETGQRYSIHPIGEYITHVESFYSFGYLTINLKVELNDITNSIKMYKFMYNKSKKMIQPSENSKEIGVTVHLQDGYLENPPAFRPRNYQFSISHLDTKYFNYLGTDDGISYLFNMDATTTTYDRIYFLKVTKDGMILSISTENSNLIKAAKTEVPFEKIVLYYHSSQRALYDLYEVLGYSNLSELINRYEFYKVYIALINSTDKIN